MFRHVTTYIDDLSGPYTVYKGSLVESMKTCSSARPNSTSSIGNNSVRSNKLLIDGKPSTMPGSSESFWDQVEEALN